MDQVYTFQVEDSRPATDDKPSAGPVYRCIYAKDGLVDSPSHIRCPWDFFSGSVEKYAKNQMLGRREVVDGKAGQYVWQTYEDVYNIAIKTGSAIRNRGVQPGDRCGIYGANCPEWIIAMEACNSHGICYVPLYDTLGPNAVEFIINHAEVSIAFVQEKKISALLTCLPRCSEHLKTIVSFGKIASEQKKEAEQLGVSCFSWEEFASSEIKTCELPPKTRDDICTIMYTSGTTGEPKGVRLTNRAILAEVLGMQRLFLIDATAQVTEEDSYFSFLPLAHVFDQVMENYFIYKGASVGFWQGDVQYLVDDIQALKPTVFCGVPRVFDRIYAGTKEKLANSGAIAKMLYHFAYDFKLKNIEKGMRHENAAPLFDKLVFSKTKQAFGGRARILISGAAPLSRHVEEFLRVTSCCALAQGYGLTESCAGCFSSISNVFPMISTVGIPLPTIEARLESVPEMGYDALSTTPRGEICIRGNTLFSGYHKRTDLTDEVLVDGWFHTGDIGEWQPSGSLKIIDRKKNIFKLSQGEYVAVENIENIYGRCSIVTSIWAYGNSFESFLVGVAIPDKKALESWAVKNEITGDFESLCKHPKARSHVLTELNNAGRSYGLKGFEMLKAIHLDPVPFDMERDLITPTFKLKRAQLLQNYKECIDQLYKDAKVTKP